MSIALDVETQDHIAAVTLIGPGKGNTLGPDFWREAPQVFADLDTDPSVRAVVLTGSGEHFCFGLDLDAMLGSWATPSGASASARLRTDLMHQVRDLQRAVNAIADCRTPVIAALSGWCIGGGLDIAAACDIRLAGDDAMFSIREAKLGIVADVGVLQRLDGVIAQGHLRELAYTGRDVDARYAERIGLVNRVYPDRASVLEAAHALAREIAANPPLAVKGTKEALDQPRRAAIGDGLRWASLWSAAFLPSHDLVEAVAAFRERRPAAFRGE